MSNEINFFDTEIEEPPAELTEERLLEMLDRLRVKKELESLDDKVAKQLRGIIEALLFASSDPLSFRKIREVCDTLFPVKPRILASLIKELQDEYQTQERAFRLETVAGGFILRTEPVYGPYVEHLYRNKRTEKLSNASSEVLAIIAFRHPITRAQIDAIRGVDSSGTLQSLVERELVHVVGRLEAPGRPSLYSVSEHFMKHFGISDLSELQEIERKVDESITNDL